MTKYGAYYRPTVLKGVYLLFGETEALVCLYASTFQRHYYVLSIV